MCVCVKNTYEMAVYKFGTQHFSVIFMVTLCKLEAEVLVDTACRVDPHCVIILFTNYDFKKIAQATKV